MNRIIDLNSDLGEGFGAWKMGDDEAMMALVSSANIACGFHAGSPSIMLKTLQAATTCGVSIGAHVSYPDLVGFGRRNMDITSDALTADVIYQIGALQGLARAAGTRVSYVKPHGALYNTIAHNAIQAQAVISAIVAVDPALPLLGLAGSPLKTWAEEANLRFVAEAFADRAIHRDGHLVARNEPGAVLTDARTIANRVVRLVEEGGMEAIDGHFTKIAADSVCLHGDNPAALAIARQIRAALDARHITIAAFAG